MSKYKEAIKTITDTADFYYSMYGAEIDETDNYWFTKWRTSLELLERILGLEENTLYLSHLEKCEDCYSNEQRGSFQGGNQGGENV